MRDRSKKLTVINTGVRRDTANDQVVTQQVVSGGGVPISSSSKSLWELKTTESGELYLFGKYPVVVQYGITSFAGDSVDIPGIYDGLPIDNQTLYWEETTNEDGSITKVLKAKGGGNGTGGSIEYALTWSGYSSGTYDGTAAQNIKIPSNTNQLTNGAGFITSSALDGYATEEWVGENYFPITGGTIQGDVRLREGSEYYGRTLYFGDGAYVYIKEDEDDHMLVYGNKGIDLEMGTSYYLNITGKGIKLNGGIFTYNSSSGYWELEGDLLVNGGITSYE